MLTHAEVFAVIFVCVILVLLFAYESDRHPRRR